MSESEHSNGELLIGLCLAGFSIFIAVEAIRMPYWEPETFYLAPGFVPLLTSVALLGFAAGTVWRSVRSPDRIGWGVWVNEVRADQGFWRLGVVFGLVAVYGVVLLGRMPFFWATLIFHLSIFVYLRVGGVMKIGISAFGATLLVAVLLPKLFEMPLP